MSRRSNFQFKRGILHRRPDDINYFPLDDGWNPSQLFLTGGNRAGAAWYDPSDLSTLFKDTAMTVPVTRSGDLVAAMKDKSGNNHHLVAPNDAARPIFISEGSRRFLRFDTSGLQHLVTVNPAGLNIFPCRGFAIMNQVDSTGPVQNFQRFASIGSGIGADTTNTVSGGGLALFLQPTVQLGIRSNGNLLNAIYANGGSLATLGVYEYNVTTINNNAQVGVDLDYGGSSGTADTSYSLPTTTSTGRVGIACHVDSSSNALSPGINANGPFKGDWYGWIHVGRIPSAAELTNIRRWAQNKVTGINQTPRRFWRIIFDVPRNSALTGAVTPALSLSSLTASETISGSNVLTAAGVTYTLTAPNAISAGTLSNLWDGNSATSWDATFNSNWTGFAPAMITIDFGASTTRYLRQIGFTTNTVGSVPHVMSLQYQNENNEWIDTFFAMPPATIVAGTTYNFQMPIALTDNIRQAAWVGSTSYELQTNGDTANNYHGMGGLFMYAANGTTQIGQSPNTITASTQLNSSYAATYLLNPTPNGIGQFQYVSAARVHGSTVHWVYNSGVSKMWQMKLRGYTFTGASEQIGRDYADIKGLFGITSEAIGSTKYTYWTKTRYGVDRYLENAREDTFVLTY